MTELPDNILHLPQYQVLGCKSTDDEMHFQVDVPDPIACEECGVQGEFYPCKPDIFEATYAPVEVGS